jgi:hypothetical protein
MKHAAELVQAFKKIAATDDPVFSAVVKAVDKTNNTCDVEFNGMELGEIRLQAIIKPGTKGLIIYPLVNSLVIVQRLGRSGDFFITMFSEVEEVLYKVGNATMSITNAGFLFQHQSETIKKILDDVLDEIGRIIVPTNVGPSGIPINKPAFDAIKIRVAQIFR